MNELEKVRFIGFNMDGQKWDITFTGIYERATADLEVRLSTIDRLRYDYVFLSKVYDPMKEIKAKKVRLSLMTDGIFHETTILLQGIAYVMNKNGDTIDVIRTQRDNK